MSLTNEIVLRPRFKFDINEENNTLLKLFEDTKNTQTSFIVSRVDDHVFIKIPKAKQHFWSPQLHLEINKNEDRNNSTLYGLFGPNPTVWTLFMFLHFVVIGLFLGFGIWAYANWSLESDYSIQLFISFLMVLIWFILYFGGRMGKKTGTDQMHELHHFMRDTLRDQDIHAENN
ncbi:GTP-binding protein [Lacinutrix sp. Bg11-31]|uniref:GTP-binding protein n=1 Tax=Lacinutrix sp. Bg11-31 TaxID=2057808 RepID=UPI000C306B96|nr:GTP-binding protein [Lacinutrix sp. Bg11-31]AUC83418.1 GTP-binding protein [Lacinutrix sp. Bg11-31]